MSTTATSGLCADTFRTRSSASPACATTSKPASPSTRTILPHEHRVFADDYAHRILVLGESWRGRSSLQKHLDRLA